MRTCTELWAAADAAWQRRDVDAALRHVDALLSLEPDHLDALNLSGVVRTTVLADTPGAWELGLSHLARALDTGTGDARVIVNYAEALARMGRASDAVPRVRAWVEAHSDAAAAWNVLGWLLGVAGDDVEGGKAALERALGARPHYGDAHLNLARIFVKLQSWRTASVELEAALQSRNCRRPHEAWMRLGEVRVAQGQLRRALGAFRRAQEVDAQGEYTRPLFDAVNALTHVLHQRRHFFLHVFDETARNQAFEARLLSTAPPKPLSALAHWARALRSVVRDPAHTALECIEEQAAQRALLARWSDQSATFDLERHGGDEGRALGLAWRAALFELYEELLEREEAGFDGDAPLAVARKAAAERRWDEALDGLRLDLRGNSERRVSDVVAELGERWGDRLVFFDEPARAKDFYAVALESAQRHSSWASSDAERLARSTMVERLRTKLNA